MGPVDPVESLRRRLVYFISDSPYKIYEAASERLHGPWLGHHREHGRLRRLQPAVGLVQDRLPLLHPHGHSLLRQRSGPARAPREIHRVQGARSSLTVG
jgi:hypothetical protein